MGFTIAFFVQSFAFCGFSFCLIGMLPAFFISTVFVLSLAIRVINEVKAKSYSGFNRGSGKIKITNYCLFVLVCFAGLAFSSIVEAFICAPIAKLVFGV